jgi:hypothetical protein
MNRQKKIEEVTKQVDGEFSDLQLVQNIITAQNEKAKWTAKLKMFKEQLAERLVERDVTEATIGEDIVTISPKMLNSFDHDTLASLKNCTTDDQIRLIIQGIPSSKQLKELSAIGGAAAKAVIESAKRKMETDTIVVRIRKPRKPRKPKAPKI